MRKRCRRRPRPESPPMLINRGLQNDVLEMRERQFVDAFVGGYANKVHFDSLVDMRNVLTIAAAKKDDKQTLVACEGMRIVLQNIRARHAETKHMDVTGDELQMMRSFCSVYRDFWLRQSVLLYETAVDELQRSLNDSAPSCAEGISEGA